MTNKHVENKTEDTHPQETEYQCNGVTEKYKQ